MGPVSVDLVAYRPRHVAEPGRQHNMQREGRRRQAPTSSRCVPHRAGHLDEGNDASTQPVILFSINATVRSQVTAVDDLFGTHSLRDVSTCHGGDHRLTTVLLKDRTDRDAQRPGTLGGGPLRRKGPVKRLSRGVNSVTGQRSHRSE